MADRDRASARMLEFHGGVRARAEAAAEKSSAALVDAAGANNRRREVRVARYSRGILGLALVDFQRSGYMEHGIASNRFAAPVGAPVEAWDRLERP